MGRLHVIRIAAILSRLCDDSAAVRPETFNCVTPIRIGEI